MYCPNCGEKRVTQMTRMIIIMQLPGSAVDCALFACDKCSARWFMEKTTLAGKPQPELDLNMRSGEHCQEISMRKDSAVSEINELLDLVETAKTEEAK